MTDSIFDRRNRRGGPKTSFDPMAKYEERRKTGLANLNRPKGDDAAKQQPGFSSGNSRLRGPVTKFDPMAKYEERRKRGLDNLLRSRVAKEDRPERGVLYNTLDARPGSILRRRRDRFSEED